MTEIELKKIHKLADFFLKLSVNDDEEIARREIQHFVTMLHKRIISKTDTIFLGVYSV